MRIASGKEVGVKVEFFNNGVTFPSVMETLTRIGIKTKNNELIQTAHILHKRNEYYIMHFKEMFLLDGKDADLTVDDIARRNKIISMLEEWHRFTYQNNPRQIVEEINYEKRRSLKEHILTVIPLKHKNDFILKSKYTIGKRK